MPPVAIGSPERKAESLADLIYGLSGAFVIISCTCVLLRVYTRLTILHTFGHEDTAIVIAQILSFGVTISTIIEVALGGLGKHIEFVTRDEFIVAGKTIYSNTMVYNGAQIMTKLSFLLQYRRLFRGVAIQRVCMTGIVFILVWGFIQAFLTGFSCDQLQMMTNWQGRCVPTPFVFSLNGVMNLLTDFAILLIPIRPVMKLKMPRRRRLNLLAVFSLGFFACIISIVRLASLYTHNGDADPSWNSAPVSYWSVIELNVGITCACLPALRPLIQKVAPWFTGVTSGRSEEPDSYKMRPPRSTGPESTAEDEMYTQKTEDVHSTSQLRSKGSISDPPGETWMESDSVKTGRSNEGEGSSSPVSPVGR